MKWYRSLYWRVAFGVIAFLAAMLVVQAVLFVWTVSQSGRSLPGQGNGLLDCVLEELADFCAHGAGGDAFIKYYR